MDFMKLKKIYEKHNLNLTRKQDGKLWNYLIEGWTTMGQNIVFETSVKRVSEFIKEFKHYVENYDCSSEAYIWLDNFGHGKNGAPYDMHDVYSDMEEIKKCFESVINEMEGVV